MKPLYLCLVIILSSVIPSWGQEQPANPCMFIPNSSMTLYNNARDCMHLLFDQPVTPSSLQRDCHHLSLDIDAAGFFFDAEYATPSATGYSVAGFRLSPALSYGINEKAQLRVGLNATAFAGLDSLYRLRPTFSLIYAPAKWLTLVAGTLYGNYSHQLGTPVYDPSRWIYNYQEDGLQILTNTFHWNSDTWLDWTHYLTPWTPDQERFTMGTRHEFIIINSYKHSNIQNHFIDAVSPIPCFSLSIPSHFVANHRGGEMKTLDTNTVTTFNERIGLRLVFTPFQENIDNHQYWTLDLPFFFYHLEDQELDHGGNAFYPSLSYKYSHVNYDGANGWSIGSTLGFWHGDHYFSALGSPLFWSANAYSLQHMPPSAQLQNVNDIRNLLTFNLSVEHEFKGLNLGLQVDALYDLDLRKTDLLFGFYMRFLGHFRLR